jgi:hypothetical protein
MLGHRQPSSNTNSLGLANRTIFLFRLIIPMDQVIPRFRRCREDTSGRRLVLIGRHRRITKDGILDKDSNMVPAWDMQDGQRLKAVVLDWWIAFNGR